MKRIQTHIQVLDYTTKIRKSSEEYIYPNIDGVKITIEGVPNSIYSQGIPKNRFYNEARRFFCPSCEKQTSDEFMTIEKLYSSGFSLVIDLRNNEGNVTGNGKKIVNTQSGILLEIKKKATTADMVCHLFVASDSFRYF